MRFPAATDLTTEPEPVYPVAALIPGEQGQKAEDDWWKDVLIWGRGGWDKVGRICDWAVLLGKELPAGSCDRFVPAD